MGACSRSELGEGFQPLHGHTESQYCQKQPHCLRAAKTCSEIRAGPGRSSARAVLHASGEPRLRGLLAVPITLSLAVGWASCPRGSHPGVCIQLVCERQSNSSEHLECLLWCVPSQAQL